MTPGVHRVITSLIMLQEENKDRIKGVNKITGNGPSHLFLLPLIIMCIKLCVFVWMKWNIERRMFYYLQQHFYNVTLEEETKFPEGSVASWEIHGRYNKDYVVKQPWIWILCHLVAKKCWVSSLSPLNLNLATYKIRILLLSWQHDWENWMR